MTISPSPSFPFALPLLGPDAPLVLPLTPATIDVPLPAPPTTTGAGAGVADFEFDLDPGPFVRRFPSPWF